MTQPLQVTVFDPETGESSTGTVEPGNYLIICAAPCYVDTSQSHANGTTVLTVKGRNPGLLGLKEVGAS